MTTPRRNIAIYVDGSSKAYNNNLAGGWSVVVLEETPLETKILHQSSGGTLSHGNDSCRMELIALFKGISLVNTMFADDFESNITIYTDHLDNAHHLFDKRKHHHNNDLWNRLPIIKKIVKKYNLKLEWVKSHSGNYGNSMADKLANKAMQAAIDKHINKINNQNQQPKVEKSLNPVQMMKMLLDTLHPVHDENGDIIGYGVNKQYAKDLANAWQSSKIEMTPTP